MASRTPNALPAPKPFDCSDRADLVIITSDGTSLYVVKAFLIYASQFFANLLGDSLPDETHEGLPVYRASEDCRTMCAVLRLCYPVETAPSEIIVDMTVLDALQKYMMEDAKERWKKTIVFLDLAKTEPLRIFAIACRCHWGNIARAAAKAVLSIPLRDWQSSAELRHITGMDYHMLVKYYTQCSDAVEEAFSSPTSNAEIAITFQSSDDATRFPNLHTFSSSNTSLPVYRDVGHSTSFSWVKVPSWVQSLLIDARDRSRNSPGRAVTCDESLVVAALNAGGRSGLRPSVVLEACQLIDAGLQCTIDKVPIQLDFAPAATEWLEDL